MTHKHEMGEREWQPGADHPVAALLPDYLIDACAPEVEARVRAHLASCAACSAQLTEWRQLATAERAAFAQPTAPSLAILDRVWASIDASDAPAVVEARIDGQPGAARLAAFTSAHMPAIVRLWQVFASQRRLLRRSVWIASAIGIGATVLFALQLGRPGSERDVLLFALPLIATCGAAFLYGPEIDPGLELALATPTSARTVLASRFLLLFLYDTLLALGATLALATAHHLAFWPLASLWFGPMALLSSVGLLLSLALGPLVAAGTAMLAWVASALSFDHGLSLRVPPALEHPSPVTWLVAAAVVLIALVFVPFQERPQRQDD